YAGKLVYEVLPTGYVQTLGMAGYAITGTSGTDQTGLDFANFLPDPEINLTKFVLTDVSGVYVDANDPDGPQASTSTTVYFKVSLENTGNTALTAIHLTDSVIHTVNGVVSAPQVIDYNDPAFNAWVDLDGDTMQDVGEEWTTLDANHDGTLDTVTLAVGSSLNVYYSLNSLLGQHENTAVVTATAVLGGASVGDNDDANYYVLAEDCVGVGTPGFWSNNGWVFWDGVSGNETKHAGQAGFADGELLYAIDLNKNGVIDNGEKIDSNGDGFVNLFAKDGINDGKPLDNAGGVGLLIGDYNRNGITDVGEDTIFISLANANSLINASNRNINGGQADGIWMLGRDVVATWLNFLANNQENDGDPTCIGGIANDGAIAPREAIDAAIDWLQQFASTTNSANSNTNMTTSFHDGNSQAVFQFDAKIATSTGAWNTAATMGEDIPYSGSVLHSALDLYNNTGTIGGIEYCCDRDDAVAMFAVNQIV
ncbi:hypothetical protein, partial [Novosphingobium sp.]|uniref:hypothetical protein n=1 Tax=Novosphingobium sp. TaxID=1874826 RepID=UPI0025DB430D